MPDPLFLQIMSSNVFPRSIESSADGNSNIKPICGMTIWVSKIADFDADFELVDKKFGVLLEKQNVNFFLFFQIFQ
jgi:hypothetical protein